MEKSPELALTQMRKSVEKLGFSTENYGDPTLMRFLIARSMDIEKAAKMFVQWLKWRSSIVPNGFIAESEVPDQLEARKIFLQEFIVYVIDKAIASGVRGRETGNEKFICIVDFQQLTYKNADTRGYITGFQILQSYFPERLAKMYALHIPRFFVSVWKMVCRFLDKATQEKIVIVTNEDEKKCFVEEVGEEAVPIEYGGKAKLTAIQDVPPLEG
ncbi:hypothetical protein COLO4_16611 [Corchorus olitorius]|uniref:CRAL-TRIO domain-containing protein n=1 Tax=Corchorus olitorius TaxID=93759 RepID=A0A1R3JGI8_9ROSI|nr:hypothetical protein COLO4_16611 [Corchorus olitorius]